MAVTIEDWGDGIKIVCLIERVDSTNAPETEAAVRALMDQGCTRILFDLSELVYISSAGLRVVLLTWKTLSKTGGRFALCRFNDNVRQVFEVSGFLPMFKVFKEREGALEYLSG